MANYDLVRGADLGQHTGRLVALYRSPHWHLIRAARLDGAGGVVVTVDAARWLDGKAPDPNPRTILGDPYPPGATINIDTVFAGEQYPVRDAPEVEATAVEN